MEKSQKIDEILQILKEDQQSLQNTVSKLEAQAERFLKRVKMTASASAQ